MAFKQVIEIYEILDSAVVTGEDVKKYLAERGACDISVETIQSENGATDLIRVMIPGTAGKSCGGSAPTLGVIGQLGGIGARPKRIGLVSDGDGALAALATGLKLLDMQKKGDRLAGDVIISTHICPNAPVLPHDPVPFMGSPIDIRTMNEHEVDPGMDAIISVDTTKGNQIVNRRGIAISPTVKEGYILRVSEDLLSLLQIVTGEPAVVLPITTQDITPYGNGLYHLNSILQPSTATKAPTVGLAITAEVPVPGCATGATQVTDVEQAVRFCIEVAKAFGAGDCRFYDPEEYALIRRRYGDMSHLQTLGLP
ncbi:MAG: DUF1177 domain-containing protein [Bacillota bacterium]